MIGKRTLKAFEFEEISDYYKYIIDSRINGNYSQVKELIKKLSSEQWIEFIKYAASMYNKSYDITYYIKARE